MNNSNGHNNGDKPSFQFRSPYTPPEVVQMLIDGDLTLTDLLVGWFIDAMVSSTGNGCWATNKFLAEKLNVATNYVSATISKLRDLGLLQVTEKNGTRYLEMCWSRMNKRPVGDKEKSTPPTEKPVSTHKEKSLTHPLNICKRDICPQATPPRSARRVASGDSERGFISTEEVKLSFEHTCAVKLYEALVAKGKIITKSEGVSPKTIKTWKEHILALRRSRRESEILKVLDWYIRNIGKPYVPEAYCAQSFTAKFPQIEQAISRQKTGTARPHELPEDEWI